ncbi:universal stress protein [Halocatena pleomorpha]|uniref:Universal stress protein n=1 Tax=Halocatena pleomorpha TaxID=1785090 RepID=A0A3P3R3E8_9EURY|nr:universal stress protein [Halocatena pleomorpha]RRJ27874.1 universal stress protein [Halocatena pleomorpha]
MEIDTVLVPIAETDTVPQVIAPAVAIAEQYDAGIHMLYVLDHDATDIDADALSQQLMEATQTVIGEVAISLSHSIIYGFSTEHLTHHPGSVVLDASNDIGADFIVLPRDRAPNALGQAADYVVQYATAPVLSV